MSSRKHNNYSFEFNLNAIRSAGAVFIARSLEINQTLRTLSMDSNLVELGSESFGAALLKNNTLALLSLNEIRMNWNGLISITNSLHSNSSLTFIDLSRNDLGLEGAACFGKALKLNTGLRTLILNCNAMRCCAPVAEALKVNRTLTVLDLSQNDITDADVLALALKDNRSLQTLKLNDNKSIIAAEFLKDNSTLTSLHMEYCEVPCLSFTEYLQQYHNLVELKLSIPYDDKESGQKIEDALNINRSFVKVNVH